MTVNDQKLLLFQIDALSHQHFQEALQDGLFKRTKKWLEKNNYLIKEYFTGLPASTFAFQANLFFGTKKKIPSYRWYEKKLKTPISASIGQQVRLVRENSNLKTRKIFEDLVVLEGIFSPGDQSRSLSSETFDQGFSLQSLKFRRPLKLLGINLPFFFEVLVSSVSAFFKSACYWLAAKKEERIPFHWWYFWGGHWFSLALLLPYYFYYLSFLIKKHQGSIYINWGGYDAFAHSFGQNSSSAQAILRVLDKKLVKIFKRAQKKGFLPILFSDHGMTEAEIFKRVSGKSLQEWISDFVDSRNLGRSIVEEYPLTETKGASLDAFESSADIFISSSGSVALIYFTKDPQRLTFEQIENNYPGLVDYLKNLPGIGLVAVKTERGHSVMGYEGSVEFEGGGELINKEGTNPLTKYGDLDLNQLALLDWIAYENQGDIILMGDYRGGKTVSFEEQVAVHMGLGGEQNWAFYCCPKNFQQEFINLIFGD